MKYLVLIFAIVVFAVLRGIVSIINFIIDLIKYFDKKDKMN